MMAAGPGKLKTDKVVDEADEAASSHSEWRDAGSGDEVKDTK